MTSYSERERSKTLAERWHSSNALSIALKWQEASGGFKESSLQLPEEGKRLVVSQTACITYVWRSSMPASVSHRWDITLSNFTYQWSSIWNHSWDFRSSMIVSHRSPSRSCALSTGDPGPDKLTTFITNSWRNPGDTLSHFQTTVGPKFYGLGDFSNWSLVYVGELKEWKRYYLYICLVLPQRSSVPPRSINQNIFPVSFLLWLSRLQLIHTTQYARMDHYVSIRK